jgi:hypothetical protein
LSGAAIDRFVPGMWRVFESVGLGMLEFVEGKFDAQHGEVNNAFVRVPLESDVTVEGAGPNAGELVFDANRVEEMVSMLSANVLDTLAPKSPITRQKVTDRMSCFQRPGVRGTGRYPFGAKCSTSWS